MPPTLNARRCPRFPITCDVRIGWIGRRREMTFVVARGVDISQRGLAIRLARPLPVSALVHLELADCGISAAGHVRYSLPDGDAWRLGIEVPYLFPPTAT
ncbi:MAG TPA: PilZ domain-containing protein [Candidatus Acidoferrales bacterium]|nr:PilZ domain-containing protein [Candidatus Acidoferrales bacterium]